MPSGSGMLSWKGLEMPRFRSKKTETSAKSTISSPAMDAPQSLPQNSVHRLQNFEELIDRLNIVFILYQVPLSEGHPIVFDEYRCNHALNLRLLLSISASDLLESDRLSSTFELHDLGLRLPENPLSMHPTCDYKVKLRRAFQDELGSIFVNTSLEVLGVITVLHILERAISWLEPLLSSEGVRNVKINMAGALHPFKVPSQRVFRPSNNERSFYGELPDETDAETFAAYSSKLFDDLHQHAFGMQIRNDASSYQISEPASLRADMVLRSEFTAYEYDKELPMDALDRWVLEMRKRKREPTLMECIRKLQRLERDYQMFGYRRGYPPPPVSARYGYIDHALRRHYRDSTIDSQPSTTIVPPRTAKEQMEIQQEAIRQEAKRQVSTALVRAFRRAPQDRHETPVKTAQYPTMGNPKMNNSRLSLVIPKIQKSTQTAKSSKYRLPFSSSPGHKDRTQLKIGAPTEFIHYASGRGLKEWEEISKTLEMTNEQASHPLRGDSVPQNYGQAITTDSDVAIETHAPKVHIPGTPQNTAFGRAVATETAGKRKSRADDVTQHSRPTSASFGKMAEAKESITSERQLTGSWEDDQDAKIVAIVTQLLLMQDVFRKARESLTAFVGPELIEKVTDIAVAYGWFRANTDDYDELQN